MKKKSLLALSGSDYFDIMFLYCHIYEYHPTEAKNGRKRKSRRGGSHSALSILRRKFPDGNFQSLFEGSSCILSSFALSNVAADQLLSTFIKPFNDEFFTLESCMSAETSHVVKKK